MNSKYPKLTRDEVRLKYREILNVENFQKYAFDQAIGQFGQTAHNQGVLEILFDLF